jgi:hypothetical protein
MANPSRPEPLSCVTHLRVAEGPEGVLAPILSALPSFFQKNSAFFFEGFVFARIRNSVAIRPEILST